jgi:hypothetical protein
LVFWVRLFFVSCLFISNFTEWNIRRARQLPNRRRIHLGASQKSKKTIAKDKTAVASQVGTTNRPRGRPPKSTDPQPLISNAEPVIQESDPLATVSVSLPAGQLPQEHEDSVPKEDWIVPAQPTKVMVQTFRKERQENSELKKKLQVCEDEFKKFKQERNSKIARLENRLEKLLERVSLIILSLSLVF